MTNGSRMSQSPESDCAPNASIPPPTDTAVAAQWKPLILALMIVALLLRIVAAVGVERIVQASGRAFLIEGDANGYWDLGQKIAAGETYAIHEPPRFVLRTPGFPLLLAGSMRLFGSSVFAARLVLAVVGAGCVWLTWCLGHRLHMRRTGFWAAVYVAIHPLHVGNSVLILSETWFTLWMLLSLIALVWLIEAESDHCADAVDRTKPCWKRLAFRATVCGMSIGAAVLVRPGFLPWLLVAVVSVSLWLKKQPWLRGLAAAGLISGCLLILLPWAARNASVTGHWVWTSLWSGPSLYDGLNPDATGASEMSFFDRDQIMEKRGFTEFEMNQYYKAKAEAYAVSHPRRVIELALSKLMRFMAPVPGFLSSRGWAVSVVCAIFWCLLFGFSWIGFKSREWNAVALVAVTGPFLLFLMVHMVFVGSVRYRLPVEFPLSVLAAIGWRHMVLVRKDSVATS